MGWVCEHGGVLTLRSVKGCRHALSDRFPATCLATFRRKYAAFRGSRDRGQTTGSSPCSGAEPIAADRAGVTDVGLDFLPSGEYLNQDAE